MDWASVDAAYGPAVAVPGLLRDLADPDRARRSEAIFELWGCLCHQGTVYEASAAAAPLVLEAARLPGLESQERTQLLALVVHIGLGEDTTWRGYTPWPVVQECARVVESLLPALTGLALEGLTEARPWALALAARHPTTWAGLGVDAEALMSSTEPAVRELVRCALADTIPDAAVVSAVVDADEELRECVDEVIAEGPATGHARALVLELADTGRL